MQSHRFHQYRVSYCYRPCRGGGWRETKRVKRGDFQVKLTGPEHPLTTRFYLLCLSFSQLASAFSIISFGWVMNVFLDA